MLRALVLDALARVARGEDASPVIRSSDPLVSFLARRRARQALFAAEQATRSMEAHHVARLAYVRAAGVSLDATTDDVAAVETAFRGAGGGAPAARYRGPWVTVGLVASVVLLAPVLGLVSWLRRPFDPHRDPVGHVLGNTLPDYVVTLTRHPDAPAPRIPSDAKRAAGPEGARALGDLFASLGPAARDPAADDAFFAATGSLDAALARSGSPFFVDADLLPGEQRSSPMVYSFYVEREDVATTDPPSSPVRVVFVWRLDTLNVTQPFLGYTHPRAAAALVLFDQLERELIDLVLPALHRGEAIDLVDEESLDPASAWQKDLQARAGDIVAQYFAGDADAAALEHLGQLIARRRAIVKQWRNELPLVGVRLVPPRASLDEWDSVHDELLRPENIATFERLRDRVARSTERHEVQHRLDYARGLVPVPARIAERLGLENTLDAAPGTYAARCRDETSAYLAQMADGTDAPGLTLLLLSHFLFDRHEWGSAYSCAAVAVFDMVSETLAVPDSDRPLVWGGAVRREELERRLAAFAAKTPGELHQAARKTWEQAYGATLPTVATREVARHMGWRH